MLVQLHMNIYFSKRVSRILITKLSLLPIQVNIPCCWHLDCDLDFMGLKYYEPAMVNGSVFKFYKISVREL